MLSKNSNGAMIEVGDYRNVQPPTDIFVEIGRTWSDPFRPFKRQCLTKKPRSQMSRANTAGVSNKLYSGLAGLRPSILTSTYGKQGTMPVGESAPVDIRNPKQPFTIAGRLQLPVESVPIAKSNHS